MPRRRQSANADASPNSAALPDEQQDMDSLV
jgi:hypothetical protein